MMLFGTLSAAGAPLLRKVVFMDVCGPGRFFALFGERVRKGGRQPYSHSIVLGGFELMS
jgi:hypothetical protein